MVTELHILSEQIQLYRGATMMRNAIPKLPPDKQAQRNALFDVMIAIVQSELEPKIERFVHVWDGYKRNTKNKTPAHAAQTLP